MEECDYYGEVLAIFKTKKAIKNTLRPE